MKLKVLGSLILTTLLFALAQGQTADGWHILESSNGEFDVAVPSRYLVYDNERWSDVRIAGGGDGAFFDLSFRKTNDGDDRIRELQKKPAERGEDSGFKVDEAKVHTYKLKDDKAFQFSIFVATRKGYYTISVTSASSENPVLKAILGSIRLGGQRLLTDEKGVPPKAMATLNVNSLKTSEIIREALKAKQTEKIAVVDGSVSILDDPPGNRGKFYSREVIILQKPYATYSDEARRSNVSGTVRLRVLLKGNGQIGRIIVLKGVPAGLTKQAVKAASALKFFPAEVLGIPTDSEVTIEYGFNVY